MENLPKVINGKKTSYHAKEVGTVDRYTTSETVTKGNVTTITNTHKYETVDKTVTKIWIEQMRQRIITGKTLK